MKLIYSLLLVAVLSACTTTTDTTGKKVTSFDPVKAQQAEELALKTANDALIVAQEAQQLKAAQKATTATK